VTPTTPTPGERRWAPNSAPQERFLSYNGFEGLYGGAAGGGKSEALLVDALYGIADPSYRAVLFRRTFPELKKSLIDRARDFYPHVGGREHKTDHVWHFPSGAQIALEADAQGGWNAPSVAPWLGTALEQASQQNFGRAFMCMGEGGSIPFMGMLGAAFPEAQFMITGVLGPGSNAHGPNEFLHIEFARRLTVCVSQVLAAHAQRHGA
jgi:hypothetical protein